MERPRRDTRSVSYNERVSDEESENEASTDPSEKSTSDNSVYEASEVGGYMHSLSSQRSHTPKKDESEELPNTELITHSFPTDSQIAQARLLALEQEVTHSRIQEEYDKQKAIMTEIEGRLRAAADTLFKTRAALAGIIRLPLEILGEIFVNHVHGNFCSPWTVMHVCRAWRNAALLTRAIWGSIMLSPSMGPKLDKTRSRIFKGRELCFKSSHSIVLLLEQVQRLWTCILAMKHKESDQVGRCLGSQGNNGWLMTC